MEEEATKPRTERTVDNAGWIDCRLGYINASNTKKNTKKGKQVA
jgi:hypothetical protein